jgi:lipopolysaccharide/colanic/teichoic acid biosynthesis glycosyltransferase
MTAMQLHAAAKDARPSSVPRRLPRSKRVLDVTVSAAALLILSPLLVGVAVLIRVTSRGPVLFRQERVGWLGTSFTLLKFRTMVINDDESALRDVVQLELAGERRSQNGSFKVADDYRITRVGAWLRRMSIDELPQLVNIVRGHMSLVGPRPALPWEHDLFPAEYRRRIEVRPGLTGLWQVSGRSRLTTPEMLQLDIAYVDSQSLPLDLSILARTVPTVVRGDGSR